MTDPMVGMLHTAGSHTIAFDRLAAEMDEQFVLIHSVEEKLLPVAIEEGAFSPLVVKEVGARVDDLYSQGADVVVCTCSTLGSVAETLIGPNGIRVQRIDRAMADQAVAFGSRILAAAALEATLEPTRALLMSSAGAADREVDLRFLVVDDAWQLFLDGRSEVYWQTIARHISADIKDAQVVVLAQASMDGAVELLSHLGVPILSSPLMGLRRALDTAVGHLRGQSRH